MTLIGTVGEIWRYPISSLSGERLARADLDASGIRGDRLYGLVDAATGEIAAPEKQRRWRPAPQLAARLGADGPEIGFGEAWHPASSTEATERLAAHLGFRAEIRPHTGIAAGRPEAVPRYKRDPIHLLTTASLARLQALLPESRIAPRRFRPNLVIAMPEAPAGFPEIRWIGRTLAVGATRLSVREGCMRCAFTVLEQGDLPLDPAILAAITAEAGTHLGVMCDVDVPGPIAIGDPMELL